MIFTSFLCFKRFSFTQPIHLIYICKIEFLHNFLEIRYIFKLVGTCLNNLLSTDSLDGPSSSPQNWVLNVTLNLGMDLYATGGREHKTNF